MGIFCFIGLHSWDGKTCQKCGARNTRLLNKLNASLFDAVRKSDEAGVLEALQQGAEIHTLRYSSFGDTPLFEAAGWAETSIVRLLLRHGADLTQQGTGGLPLFNAALWGKMDAIEVLLEYGADLNAVNSSDQTCLSHGIALIHAGTVSGKDSRVNDIIIHNMLLLLHCYAEKGLNVNATDKYLSVTPLMYAVKAQQPALVRSLLEHGADTTLRDYSKKTALDYAREYGNREIITLLENQ